jgi:hypothetical protein
MLPFDSRDVNKQQNGKSRLMEGKFPDYMCDKFIFKIYFLLHAYLKGGDCATFGKWTLKQLLISY